MFGKTIDYYLLRPLTHKRGLALEEGLNKNFKENFDTNANGYIKRAQQQLRDLLFYFEGRVPIKSSLRYLDIGCGKGENVLALASFGCEHVTGVDIMQRNIDQAEGQAELLATTDRVRFVCQDFCSFSDTHLYDVIFSFAAFEHYSDPKDILQKMVEFTVPNGIAVIFAGFFFHSPFGDHMRDFFKFQIPWRGVIFSEKAILRLRQECFRPGDCVHRYQDVVGGLNCMRYSEFLRLIKETGWKIEFLGVNQFLRKKPPPMHLISNALVKIPFVQDYFAGMVHLVLRKTATQPPQHRRKEGRKGASV